MVNVQDFIQSFFVDDELTISAEKLNGLVKVVKDIANGRKPVVAFTYKRSTKRDKGKALVTLPGVADNAHYVVIKRIESGKNGYRIEGFDIFRPNPETGAIGEQRKFLVANIEELTHVGYKE